MRTIWLALAVLIASSLTGKAAEREELVEVRDGKTVKPAALLWASLPILHVELTVAPISHGRTRSAK